jgi:hypothetical protein
MTVLRRDWVLPGFWGDDLRILGSSCTSTIYRDV